MISVIITSYNEGAEVAKTIRSIRQNTNDCEIILVDDGSDDGSCKSGMADKLVRHDTRIGIAASRNDGVAAAGGDLLAFLDAHQSVSEGCLNKLADLAKERNAIAYPCVRGPEDRRWSGHGCTMDQKVDKKSGLFGAQWITMPPREPISRCATMIVPGYVFTRDVYNRIRWIEGMAGWGASEPAITVKAFFLDIDVLHLCGPLSRHVFHGKVPYSCPWSQVVRNHALVARVCFEDKTWRDYWLKLHVFRKWLKDKEEMNTELIVRQHREFQAMKKRPDDEFWYGLIKQERAT